MDLAPDVLGWVGLNAADHPGERDVLPIVGVRHETVERLYDEIEGRQESYPTPTVAKPLPMVIGDRFARWQFLATEPIEPIAAALARAILEHALPYMRSHATLESLLDEIPDGNDRTSVPYRVPIVLALLGRHDEAERRLVLELRRLADDPRPYAERFRTFAQLFRARDWNKGQ